LRKVVKNVGQNKSNDILWNILECILHKNLDDAENLPQVFKFLTTYAAGGKNEIINYRIAELWCGAIKSNSLWMQATEKLLGIGANIEVRDAKNSSPLL